MAHIAPPRATQDELLAPATVSRSPVWNWKAELADAERAELDWLRDSVADLRAQTAELRERAHTATATAQDLRAALTRLAHARPWQRRQVTVDLRASGLLR